MKRGRWASSSTTLQPHLPTGQFRTQAAILLLCLDLLARLGLVGPLIAQAADSLLQFSSAEFILSDSREPAADSAPWQLQALPDDWRVSRPATYGDGWYRVRFEWPAEPDQLYAAYMPLLQTVGALYVNGVYAGQSGTFDRPPPGFHRRWSLYEHPPQLFAIRSDLLHAGENTLHLRLRVYKGARGTASTVTVGPETEVRALYERWLFVAATGLNLIVVVGVGCGLFMLLLWLRRPQESDPFVMALDESGRLNTELEARVAQKRAELQENYRRMQEMERQQAMVEERQRIMRDIHDGIGAHLISTLSQVEHGCLSPEEVAAALRECIDDLRLTIDSLEPTDDDLLAVLGNLRYRLEPRLKKCGIELDWQVRDVPKLACLGPRNVLHILRILQEGFTNILKHADANRVSVETGVDRGNVFVRVKDNGHGFAGDHSGRGLASMKHRARSIGGQFDIQPSPAGTTLNLLLPVS